MFLPSFFSEELGSTQRWTPELELSFWRSLPDKQETADLAPADAAGEPLAFVAHNRAQFALSSFHERYA